MMPRVVIDTNVFISALNSKGGTARSVLRLCLNGAVLPIMGDKLFAEYEDVMGREKLLRRCRLSLTERGELLDAFLSVCTWTTVYFLWRPNLIDEGDNHVLELAIAGGAGSIVTYNVKDFRQSDLRFEQVQIETPIEFLNRIEPARRS